MTTLLKIRGLDRAASSVDHPNMSRGFRVMSPFQQAENGTGMAKATLTPTATNVSFTALENGAYGNNISVVAAVGGTVPVVATTFATGTGYPTITVTAPATATLAANQAIATAVNNDPTASQYVVAAATGAAAWAAAASAPLAGGSDGTGSVLNPIYLRVAGGTVVVDVDNQQVVRSLRRAGNRFLPLGQP